MSIAKNVEEILTEISGKAELTAAAKTRTSGEVLEAIEAGVPVVGENYVQEAEDAYADIGNIVRWHFIGHLQKNKVKKAVRIFDVIETLDSIELAREINKRCKALDKTIDVFIEVNSGREPQKFGVFPEEVEDLIRNISSLGNIKVKGLMTMGPLTGDPEEARPYFSETRKVFDAIKSMNIPGAEMKYLSMGMTNSYKVAIEEGANLVRLGTKIFGERDYS